MDNIKFGKFIKELRQEKKMTQKELAAKLNLTDKAISKWERGLSFPDITMLNSLSDVFNVSVPEILNGERGREEQVDVEKVIQEAIEKITLKKESKERRILKIKKIVRIISIITFVISFIVQSIYLIFLKRYNFEYVIDILFYVVNQIIIISGSLSFILMLKKNKVKRIFIYIVCLILTIINLAFMINNGFENKCIVDFSNDFSHELVLKQNRKTGATTIYKNSIILFARPKEQFSYEVSGNIKRQWLENDICNLTYTDKNGKLREYVATYGDRGEGISYYSVATAIRGDWQVKSQYGTPTKLKANTNGIKVIKNGITETFEYKDCKQFGTIALVLYSNEIPRYVIGLDKNCEIDKKTCFIKKDGTITIAEVSMDKTISESLYCIIYKNSEDMTNYNIVDLSKNEYNIRDGILYISYDGEKIVEVPGDFSNIKDYYNDYNYQISSDKTIFFNVKNGQKYLIYSDDMGQNWETVKIKSDSTIESIQFINSNIGYMLEFTDTALGGIAGGRISKTLDGGKTWNIINNGIESGGQKIFKTSSKLLFVTENIGFLTMPQVMGEYSELYITKDGGQTFDVVKVSEDDIYDCYKLPILEKDHLYLKITKGTDGNYENGEKYKEYYSYDNGNSWNLKQ